MMAFSGEQMERIAKGNREFEARVKAQIETGMYPPGKEYLAVDDVRKSDAVKREGGN